MGEIADMMLDGTLCQECGVFIGGPVEYPRTCGDCEKERFACALCSKLTESDQALADHKKDMHGSQACDICGKELAGRQGVLDHKRMVHEKVEDGR